MEIKIKTIDSYKIITVQGIIDWENAKILDFKIKKIIDEGYNTLVIDLNEVRSICSGGIGAIVFNFTTIKKKDGIIYIISSNDYINYLFETLKLNIIFDGFIFKSVKEFSKKIINKLVIIVVPGKSYGVRVNNFIRISFGMSTKIIKEACQRIFNEYKKNL